MKPFWQNARVIAVDADPRKYQAQAAEPGDPKRVLSRSDLVRFGRCPAKWIRGIPEKESKSMRFGTLVDCWWLTPQHWDERVAVRPEKYPHEDKKTGEKTMKDWAGQSNWCKAWMAEAEKSGKTITGLEERSEVFKAVDSLRAVDCYKELETEWYTQVWCEAEHTDQATGLTITAKVLLDILPSRENATYGKCLADLKTCRRANLRTITREVFEFGYHVQAALSTDLYELASGEDRPDWLLVLVENEAPYHTEPSILAADYVELGRSYYMRQIARYCQCLKSGVWPPYEPGAERLGPWRKIRPQDWMAEEMWMDAPTEDAEQVKDDSSEEGPVTP